MSQVVIAGVNETIDQSALEAMRSIIKSIHYMDIDSPRFIDYVTGTRSADGYTNTTTSRHLMSNTNIQATLDEMIEMLPSFEDMLIAIAKENNVASISPNEVIYSDHESDNIFRRTVVYRNSIAAIFSIGSDSGSLAASGIGNRELVKNTIGAYKEKYSKRLTVNYDHLVGFGSDGPIKETTILTREEAKKGTGNDAFYPFIKGGLTKLVEEYTASSANILLLIGAPGLGKTTLLRTLNVMLGREANVLATDESVITNPGFLPFIHGIKTKSTLAIEDADNLLAKRKDGNAQMSGMLSFADGVVKKDIKMMISTNLASLNSVDDALYRDGRTFEVIEFRALTPEEANAARVSIDLPEVDFGDLTELTLAKALNWNPDRKVLGDAHVGMGFRG